MKRRTSFYMLSLVVVLSMLLASCQTVSPTASTGGAQPTAVANFEPMKVAAPDCSYGSNAEFKSIEAVDQYTVKFTLCFPDPAFPSKVAFNVFAIANKNSLDKAQGDSVKMSDQANGTGPFMLKSWTRGDNVTYTANPNYWGPKPAFQTLIFKWSEQSAQRLLELQSGQVDGIDNPAPEDFDTIKNDSKLTLYPRQALNIFYIGFNNTIAPFDNEKFRQAIAYGIDRQRIVNSYYPKGSSVANVFVPPAMKPGYSDTPKWYEYNQDEAKKLLQEIGWKSSDSVTLYYRNVTRSYLPSPDKVAQEIQAQLKEVGLDIKLEEQELTTFIDNSSAGKLGFYLLGWGADYPDATNFYDYHLANDNNAQFGKLYSDIADPIRQAAKIADATARQKLYDQANAAIKQHVPLIPVAHGGSAVAFQAGVKNAMTSPLGNEPFYLMDPGKDTLVWLQNGEPAALWCSDETDGESLRACQQIYEPLLNYKAGSVEVVPWLAESYDVNQEVTEYTFHLRKDVKFQDGSALNANDVVATYKSMWDASDPNHKGRTATFEYFGAFFGDMLNAPKQ